MQVSLLYILALFIIPIVVFLWRIIMIVRVEELAKKDTKAEDLITTLTIIEHLKKERKWCLGFIIRYGLVIVACFLIFKVFDYFFEFG